MRVAFTGHRPDKLGNYVPDSEPEKRVRASLVGCLEALKADQPDLRAISGMALGVDQWAAEVCLSLEIPFMAAIPFEGQEKIWPWSAKQRYYKLLELAEARITVCPGDYRPYKLQKRNEWMVDNCDLLLAVWDGSPGGTANCVRYATSTGRQVQALEW
jgi:uncharacterized phage-like protein YoqJ